MTKAQFIEELQSLATKLENGGSHHIGLKNGYIFGNQHFAEVNIKLTETMRLSVLLFDADAEKGD